MLVFYLFGILLFYINVISLLINYLLLLKHFNLWFYKIIYIRHFKTSLYIFIVKKKKNIYLHKLQLFNYLLIY